MGMKKLYMIGMDSVPLWVLKELRKEKGMEIFDAMLRQGTLVDMESTLPPMTGPAWPSMYTGLNPSEHGVPDFFVMKEDYTPDIVYYDSSKVPPFWKALADAGKRCLVITPATDIKLPGYGNIDMITGFPLPAKASSAELEALMKKNSFRGEPDIEMDIKNGKMGVKEAVGIFSTSVRKRVSIAESMMARHDYDFVYVCFTETDRLQHFVMGKEERNGYILPIYRELASFVSRIAKRAEREGSLMIVVSDHGMQPIKGKFLINAWMAKKGYVKLKDSFMKSAGGDSKASSLSYGVREKLMKTKLRRVYDRMPHQVKSAAFKVLGTAFSASMHGEYVRLHLFDFDMKGTGAFAAIANEPVSTIWINDSRFSTPFVARKDRKAFRARLISDLKAIKSPEGDALIVDVIDGPSYYGKESKFIMPDLFVEAKKGYTIDLFNYSGETDFMKPEGAKSGDHLRHGIFGYHPKSFRIGTSGMKVSDVAPLVLGYFGIGRAKVARR